MKYKLCILDRDGVLNVDTGYVHEPDAVQWVQDSREAVAWLNRQGIRVVVVTNQSGVARGYFTEEDVQALHRWMQEEIGKKGGRIDAFYYCPHLPGAVVRKYDIICECRKPKPGMILRALSDFHADTSDAFLIGDSRRDVESAESVGVRGFLFTGGSLLEFVKQCCADTPSV